MLPYWLLFAIPSLAIAVPGSLERRTYGLLWLIVACLFAVFIGFRFEVGADWFNYVGHYRLAYGKSWLEAVSTNDPGYATLNWISGRFDAGVQFVNLVSGAILMAGVVAFARRQPLDWLALAVAVPYLITVVAMGYTRQSVALGFELLALNALAKRKNISFVMLVLTGALFHKTAVILLPLAALASSKGRVWTAIWVSATTLIALQFLLRESSEQLWTTYVEHQMHSQGALVRVLMNAAPAILFLLFRRHFNLPRAEHNLWVWISLISLALLPLVGFASTAVDRIALYLIPIQMFVLSRFPLIFADRKVQSMLIAGILAYSAAVLFVWLNFASHAEYWLPYRFVIF